MYAFKDKDLPHYTYEDYVQWDGRWELIHGIPYAMSPAPSMYHQNLNGNILSELKSGLSKCGKCKAYMPIDWKVDEDTVFQPDALVVCQPFEEGAFLSKTPSVIFEILSPATSKKDLNLKYDIYEKEKVKYYVIVNPKSKKASVYILNGEEYKLAGEFGHETYEFDIEDCSFSFDFSKIW